MRGVAIISIVLVLLMIPAVSATTIAVDVSHGEGTVALVTPVVDPISGKVVAEGIIPTLSWYEWGYIGYSLELEKAKVKRLGESITPEALQGVDILILGHLQKELSPEEVKAIVEWFSEGGKVLWVSGDSERNRGAYVQRNANKLLEALPGVKLRIDYATVKDTFSNAGKSYYVAGYVRVDLETPDASILTKGYQGEFGKVLFHEPGVLAWVDENGEWHPLVAGEMPGGVYRIVTTSGNGLIEDDYAPEARAYTPWQQGLFSLLAVEFVKLPNGGESLLIVSTETPYGGQVPIWVNRYGSYLFDGQQFVTNLLRWAIVQSEKMKPPERETTTTTTTTTTKTPTETPTTTVTTTTTTQSPTSTTQIAVPQTVSTPGGSSKTPIWLVGVIVVLAIGTAVLAFLLMRRP